MEGGSKGGLFVGRASVGVCINGEGRGSGGAVGGGELTRTDGRRHTITAFQAKDLFDGLGGMLQKSWKYQEIIS